MDRVVNAKDDDKRPGEGHQNAVGVQRMSIMRLAPSKRIVGGHFAVIGEWKMEGRE